MLDVLAAIRHLIHRIFHFGSAAFDKAQNLRAAKGQVRSFRVLEAAKGEYVQSFMATLCTMFCRNTSGVRLFDMNLKHRSLAFRAISRCGCAIHQLLLTQHRRNPYRLFLILAGLVDEVLEMPGCLRDELAEAYFQRFATKEEILSPTGIATLQTIASVVDTDISAMEARHAVTRRLTVLRSLQTWGVSLEDVNVQWTIKQAAKEYFLDPSRKEKHAALNKKDSGKAKRKAKHRHGPGGKGGGGGSWRAFLHVEFSGSRFNKQTLKEASQRYRGCTSHDLHFEHNIFNVSVQFLGAATGFWILAAVWHFKAKASGTTCQMPYAY